MLRPLLLALVLLTGCGAGDSSPPAGAWRAVVTLPGGELPYQLQLDLDSDSGPSAVFINGEERVRAGTVTWQSPQLIIAMPAFNTRIEARYQDGAFDGTLTLVKSGGKLQVMPWRAVAGLEHRFFADADASPAPVAGRWAVTFVDDDGVSSAALAEFEQAGDQVTGTFLTPTGDYRYLAGQVRDNTLFLSTFDGAHAFLFAARLQEDGRLEGDFWSGTQWHEAFTARLDPAASLPDADALAKVIVADEAFHFSFPNSQGKLVSNRDGRYQGKVLIVALAGSWCPNCHDEAAFLSPFYRANRERGLEVIGLMFEHLPDFPAAATQVEAFRAKFAIGYELLVAGGSDKTEAARALGLLDRVVAYPTMIVLDRRGKVRKVHSGFSGPGTGARYTEFVAGFGAFIDELLAEETS